MTDGVFRTSCAVGNTAIHNHGSLLETVMFPEYNKNPPGKFDRIK